MKLAPMSEGAEETFKDFLAEAYAYSPKAAARLEVEMTRRRKRLALFPKSCAPTTDPAIRFTYLGDLTLTIRYRDDAPEIAAIRMSGKEDSLWPREVFGPSWSDGSIRHGERSQTV